MLMRCEWSVPGRWTSSLPVPGQPDPRHQRHVPACCSADERIAALWENCKAAQDELAEQPAHVRRAVALARMQLDPLALLASLAGPRQELLSLSLYDMQDALSEEERTRVVEQQLITAANQVGRARGAAVAQGAAAGGLQGHTRVSTVPRGRREAQYCNTQWRWHHSSRQPKHPRHPEIITIRCSWHTC